MTLFIFNPSHEMALAADNAQFTPPAAVVKFERDLTLLPAIYANNGDAILAQCRRSELTSLKYYQLTQAKNIEIIAADEKIHCLPDRIIPWGWNKSLANKLLRLGIPASLIPEAYKLNKIRTLASRLTSLEFYRRFAATDAFLKSRQPVAIRAINEIESIVSRFNDGCVIKSIYSSSGRGVLISRQGINETAHRRITDNLRRQQATIIEPLWENICDFASEWICRNNEAHYLGLSRFDTDEHGRYAGNKIKSQTELTESLPGNTKKYLPEILARQKQLINELIASHYDGPLGIDMLIDNDGYINPCVEINLRMTMGHVALSHEILNTADFLEKKL